MKLYNGRNKNDNIKQTKTMSKNEHIMILKVLEIRESEIVKKISVLGNLQELR